MDRLKEFIEKEGGYEWGEMTILEQGNLREDAAAELADLLAVVEAAEPVAIRWREICGPYTNVALCSLEAALARVKPQ